MAKMKKGRSGINPQVQTNATLTHQRSKGFIIRKDLLDTSSKDFFNTLGIGTYHIW
ncbi:hypothetical protein SDC9_139988 [bioreactor metagenome]|uniref:Uncharacterized protein n=1 Tax=bioreactor metagenome TaxID=1076179 RepID=A0A645DWZ0_9ZZZZ